FGWATADGMSVRSELRDPSTMMLLLGFPEQPRIERHCGKHRQHDYGAERRRRWARLNRRERLELDERYENHHHIHIQHRPRTDEFEDPIESRTFHRPMRPTKLHRNEQIGEGAHLCKGYHDA